MENSKKRNSSLELLRIISMLLIIFCHYSSHGGYSEIYASDFSFNTCYLKVLTLFGEPACSIFAMITGYFMIDMIIDKDFYKRIIPIIFRMSFCSLFVFLIVLIFNGNYNIDDILKTIFPLIFNNNWYITTYVELFFFIPFINKFINNLNKNEYRKLLLIVYIIFFLISSIPRTEFATSKLFFMFVMYLIGAYYKKYGKEDFTYDNKYNLFIGLGFMFIMILSVIISGYIGYLLNNDFIYDNSAYLGSYHNIISIGFSFFIFVYFANKEFYSSIINVISSTTLSIYMLHDNSLMYQFIWRCWSSNADNLNNIFIHSLIKCLCIFVICMLIDLIRQKTLSKLFKKKVYPRVYKIIEKIFNSKLFKDLLFDK